MDALKAKHDALREEHHVAVAANGAFDEVIVESGAPVKVWNAVPGERDRATEAHPATESELQTENAAHQHCYKVIRRGVMVLGFCHERDAVDIRRKELEDTPECHA